MTGRLFERFRRLTDTDAVTGLVFSLAFVFAGIFAFQFLPWSDNLPRPELDLVRDWDVCVPRSSDISECTWSKMRVPLDIQSNLLADFQGWVAYRVRFTAPEACASANGACAFFFQEIGDAAEARLNGHVIGRHGQFPPQAVYAKHYPVRFQVSRDSLLGGVDSNELQILAYSMKKTQAGVRAPPVGLYTVENAFRLAQRFTTVNVINPVLSFVALFMIAALSFAAAGPELRRDPRFAAFVRYGWASACFLLSISEVPREYLPIGLAGYVHFSLRILHDWSLFELVASYFDFNRRFVRVLRSAYMLVLAAFFVQFLVYFVAGIDGAAHTGRGFDIGFLTLRIAFPILVLPHLMGIYGAFQRRGAWEGKVALSLFVSTLVFQLHDSAIFHGYMPGIYYVKWYPLVTGVVFGLFFLDHAREARAKARVEQEQTNQMRLIHEITVGIAHDMEEPFKAVEMGFKELQRRPDNQELVKALAETFPKKLSRVYELNRAILSYSKELSTTLELDRQRTDLKAFLDEIADEYREQPAFRSVQIDVLSTGHVHADVDTAQMRRVFRNLIRNGLEACAGRADGRVIVELRSEGQGMEVLISDNGPGVSPKVRGRLFRPFETYGKENGTGLGLALSRRLVAAHGGNLDIRPSSVGATFQVVLPG